MIWVWIGFIVFVLTLLALDLGVFHRKSQAVSVKEALIWSAVWITIGVTFTVFVYYGYEEKWFGLGTSVDSIDEIVNDGKTAAIKYLTGYVIEKSLSVDNIFVIAMIFTFFGVPAIYQHRVLFWGVIGALALRGLMIGVGAALVAKFHWILYLFGIFLIFTAIKMLLMKEEQIDLNQNIIMKLTKRFFPVTDKYHGEHFWVRGGTAASRESAIPGAARETDSVAAAAKLGAILLTPLALTLVIVEAMDIVFAVDSIPAIFAITADPFLVFTSNVFAILGLRSLYFALSGMMNTFRYLKPAIAIVLMVVGTKMLFLKWLKSLLGEQFNFYVLGVVFLILGAGILASVFANRRRAHQQKPAA